MEYNSLHIISPQNQDLKLWFNLSKLSSLYIVGSTTTAEYNKYGLSDIDLVGIADTDFDMNNVPRLRTQLRSSLALSSDQIPKIGFRVRAANEINDFRIHMLANGYNMDIYAKPIYMGNTNWTSLQESFKINNQLLLNVLLERLWIDYRAKTMLNDHFLNYAFARSVLDMAHIYLAYKGVYLFTHSQRVKYIIDNKLFEIFEASHLVNCLKIKLGTLRSSKIEKLSIAQIQILWEQILLSTDHDDNFSLTFWGVTKYNVKDFGESSIKVYRNRLFNLLLNNCPLNEVNKLFNPNLAAKIDSDIDIVDILNFNRFTYSEISKRDWA